MAALSTIAAIGAGALAGKLLKPKTDTSVPQVAALPAAPDPAIAARQAQEAAQTAAAIRNRRAQASDAFNGTLLTGPSPLAAPVPVQRKTLLGN